MKNKEAPCAEQRAETAEITEIRIKVSGLRRQILARDPRVSLFTKIVYLRYVI